MKYEAHIAALRAASKVAFSVAVLAGCAEQSAADPASDDPSQESEVKGASACDGGKKFTCDDLVNAAFPTPGNYPGKKVTVSKEVASCCDELLESKGAMTPHRWDCCANTTATDEKIGMACTPWGPPVPPAMKRRRVAAVAEGIA